MKPAGLLVTGTDTGVGKSVVTAAIVAALARRGRVVCPLKPVESGVERAPADAALLARSAGWSDWREANVYALAEPLAPCVAAKRAGVVLELAAMDARVDALRRRGDLVVEGVGGALVEVARGTVVADLPRRWRLAAVIVAGNRLGVLNHTLLTVEALRSRGALIAGVVLNTLRGGPPSVAEETNEAELVRLLPADVPLLGRFPFVPPELRDDPSSLAEAGDPLAGRLLGFLG